MTPELEDLSKQADTAAALESVAVSSGGKIIQASLVKDIVACVERLGAGFKTMSLAEFISTCADMKSKTDLLRTLSRAGRNKDFLRQELEDALKE